ncbi:MAG: type II toxin-antitoxin system RelE/ParE family toxin [Sphingomonas sp.]
MLPVRWSDKALDDLEEIVGYIEQRNFLAAQRLRELVEGVAERLPDHPFLYRRGRVPETREAVVHPNYIVVYRVGDRAIDIVAVVHARQQYP